MSTQPWGSAAGSLTEEPRGPGSDDPRTPPWHNVLIEGGGRRPTPAPETSAPNATRSREGPFRARLELSDVSVTQAGVACEVRVALAVGDETFTGSASSAAVPSARHRAIARATVDAVNQVLGDDGRLELLSLDELSPSGAPARLVSSVLLVTPSNTETLVGAALEGDRPEIGVARATLDAVNRRLALGVT